MQQYSGGFGIIIGHSQVQQIAGLGAFHPVAQGHSGAVPFGKGGLLRREREMGQIKRQPFGIPHGGAVVGNGRRRAAGIGVLLLQGGKQLLPILALRYGQGGGLRPVEIVVFPGGTGFDHQLHRFGIAALQRGPQQAVAIAVGHRNIALIEQQTQGVIFPVAGGPQKLLRLYPQHRFLFQPALAQHCDDPEGRLPLLHGPQPQTQGMGLAIGQESL